MVRWLVFASFVSIFYRYHSVCFFVLLIRCPNIFLSNGLVIFLDLLEFFFAYKIYTHQSPDDKWMENMEDSAVCHSIMVHSESTNENILHRMANKLSSQFDTSHSWKSTWYSHCGSHHFLPHAVPCCCLCFHTLFIYTILWRCCLCCCCRRCCSILREMCVTSLRVGRLFTHEDMR